MRAFIWLGCVWLLVSVPAQAQSPITGVSIAETGWTSNATDSVDGPADFFVTQTHELTLMHETETANLRGALAMSQTRFVATQFEDDSEVSANLEASFALGQAMVLRVGYGVTQSWTGDDLAIGGATFATQMSRTLHEAGVEVVAVGQNQQATFNLIGRWRSDGDTEVDGLGLAPLRLGADIGFAETGLGWEHTLSDALAVLADLRAWFTVIEDNDQVIFQRAPVDQGRVSAGLRWVSAGLAVDGLVGVDLVVPKVAPELSVVLPYHSFKATVQALSALSVGLSLQSGVELVDPIDGAAGATSAAEVSANYQLTEMVEVFASIGSAREVGIFDPSLVRNSRIAAVGIGFGLSQNAAIKARAALEDHEVAGERFDKATLSLALTGQI